MACGHKFAKLKSANHQNLVSPNLPAIWSKGEATPFGVSLIQAPCSPLSPSLSPSLSLSLPPSLSPSLSLSAPLSLF